MAWVLPNPKKEEHCVLSPEKLQSKSLDFGAFCAMVCFAQTCIFALVSVWVSWAHKLPLVMAFLWLLGGLASLLSPFSFFWGISAMVRGELVRGLGALVVALATPIWFMFGIVSATHGP